MCCLSHPPRLEKTPYTNLIYVCICQFISMLSANVRKDMGFSHQWLLKSPYYRISWKVNWRFGGTCHEYRQGREIGHATIQHEAGGMQHLRHKHGRVHLDGRYAEGWSRSVCWLASTTNSVALVRERTISTERPQLAGEVSANFCG
jgi:hypothetical protein